MSVAVDGTLPLAEQAGPGGPGSRPPAYVGSPSPSRSDFCLITEGESFLKVKRPPLTRVANCKGSFLIGGSIFERAAFFSFSLSS